MKNILLTLMVFGIVGCATSYKDLSDYNPLEGGGYQETQINNQTWEVTFFGNGFTGAALTENYALRRAAELTLAKGFDHFKLEDRNIYYGRFPSTTIKVRFFNLTETMIITSDDYDAKSFLARYE